MGLKENEPEINMVRLILIACLVWLLLVFVQKLRQARQSGQERQERAVVKKQMVQCVYCSVYVPKDDALRKNDDYFCCTSHMELNQE